MAKIKSKPTLSEQFTAAIQGVAPKPEPKSDEKEVSVTDQREKVQS